MNGQGTTLACLDCKVADPPASMTCPARWARGAAR